MPGWRREWWDPVNPEEAFLTGIDGFAVSFTAELFRYPGAGGWVFAPVPEEFAPPVTHGWGRTPVVAEVDGQRWQTSVWRGKDGRTLLAVPQRIRRGKDDGDQVEVRLTFAMI